MKEKMPAALVRAVFAYDRETGRVTWAIDVGRYGRVKVGTEAGYVHTDQDGYRSRYVSFQGRSYKLTHVIWAWMTGEWPTKEIDHKNVDSLDDRWDNLRQATKAEQKQNQRKRKDNKTGYKCVVRFNDPRYRVSVFYRWQVVVNGKRIKSSQRFFSAKEAHEAYCAKLPELHGDFANKGA